MNFQDGQVMRINAEVSQEKYLIGGRYQRKGRKADRGKDEQTS